MVLLMPDLPLGTRHRLRPKGIISLSWGEGHVWQDAPTGRHHDAEVLQQMGGFSRINLQEHSELAPGKQLHSEKQKRDDELMDCRISSSFWLTMSLYLSLSLPLYISISVILSFFILSLSFYILLSPLSMSCLVSQCLPVFFSLSFLCFSPCLSKQSVSLSISSPCAVLWCCACFKISHQTSAQSHITSMSLRGASC